MFIEAVTLTPTFSGLKLQIPFVAEYGYDSSVSIPPLYFMYSKA